MLIFSYILSVGGITLKVNTVKQIMYTFSYLGVFFLSINKILGIQN